MSRSNSNQRLVRRGLFSVPAPGSARRLHRALSAPALVAVALAVTVAPEPVERPAPDRPAQHAAPDRPDCEARWRPPVDAAIVDGFRRPDHRYGPGNRGLEYATEIGDAVHAVSAGTVVFAGPVGGTRFVVIQHGPDIKATYGYLADSLVAAGQSVTAGERIASAAEGFHLTARRITAAESPERGEVYLDPLPLLVGDCFVARLVPLPDRR